MESGMGRNASKKGDDDAAFVSAAISIERILSHAFLLATKKEEEREKGR